jgi:diguanylate cyclase (GGDEF)-like protein/PAS domain S-box-containing protein
MGRRDPGPSGKRSTQAIPPAAPAPDLSFRRSQLLLECTRLVFRATHESALVDALCALLVHPGLYTKAGITFGDAKPKAAAGRVSFPLRLKGRTAGVLALSMADERQPDATELEQLQALADDLSCAIERLRNDAPGDALATSERRLRETFEQAGVGITRIDMNGRFIEVNQKFCEMLGYEHDDLVGRPTRDFTVPEDFGAGPAFRAQAQLGRASVLSGEKRYVRKDGTHLWVRRTLTAARDENGNFRDAISVVEDITERKVAEEAARTERTLLRTIIDAVPHYIYVKDADGRFTLANSAWLEGRGLKLDHVRGQTVYDVFPQEFAASMDAQDRPVLDDGTSIVDVEQRTVSKAPDGTLLPARWSLTTKVPLRDAAGKVVGLVGISRDITAAKRTEKELRDYVERFEIAARATSDVLWDWDLAAGTLWWGEAFETLFGYSRQEVGNSISSWTERIHPEQVDDIGRGIHEAIDDGSTFWTADYQFRRADGTYANVFDRAYIIRDEHGRAVRMLGAIMDITDRKRAEEAMRRERALLRTIINALPDYIHVKDAEGRVQLGNTAWLKARRVTAHEVQGKTVFDIFPAALAQRMHEQDRDIIASGKGVSEQESRVHLLDEGGNPLERWSSTTKVPMRDDDGNTVGIVGISRDITSRRRMERERAMEHVVARELSESRSIEDTMPRLIRTVCEAMGWTYGAHWTRDDTSDGLRRAAWWCEFDPQFEPDDAVYWDVIATPHAGGLLGRAWLEQRATWVTDIAQMETFRRKASCLKFGFRSAYAFPIVTQDERLGVVEFFSRELREPDEALLEVSGAISNQIGQFIRRKQAEESLQESEQQLRAMFDYADVGIVVTSLDMRYLRVNDKYCEIIGYSRDELLRMQASDVNLESNVGEMLSLRQRMVKEDIPNVTMEKQLVRKDGTTVWVSLANSLVRASDGAAPYFIAVIQDISESKRASEALKESEEQFRKLAHYDILTTLPNRALFYDRLGHSIAQAKRNRWALAVLFIDVDRFKHVNDTFGHAAGDVLLKQVSERLTRCVRSDDTVGRLSGDEFSIVLSRLAAPEDAATVAKKIVEELNRPFLLEGAELFVTASIGITVFPTDSTDQDTLIRNADVAMYRAKDRGRNNYQFYTPEMNRRTREMLNMEGELRRALERDELVLHYQPKVSLTTGRVTGVEALMRWLHPERGLISPGDFMPLLEETGLIVQAGEWVLRTVCQLLKGWQHDGTCMLPVAINLSARQFLSPELGKTIRLALQESGVNPSLLEVEITESAIMADTAEATRTLEYLEALGVNSAIDDFGTGYSSLAYLKRFPLRALKIDRSFVRDVTTDPDDASIIKAVISMAHSLGLNVIAEGVETEDQLEFLIGEGCDEVQGFLFSRPIPNDECAVLLADEQRMAAIIAAIRNRRS